ncbi:hypothetical protein Q9L58_010727, partial [Maublancomyces gigas]
VRISAEIWYDSTVTSFDSTVADAGIAKLQLNSPSGGARTHVWDEKNHILLSATPPLDFITSVSISILAVPSGIESFNREFLLADLSGKKSIHSLALIPPEEPTQLIGNIVDVSREPWISQRVFGESVTSLKARKEFVQYGIDEATKQQTAEEDGLPKEHYEGEDTKPEDIPRKHVRRLVALEDLRWLMKEHGTEGVWLWDPFLNAEDVLRTLFFCPHNDVPLRALTAGKTAPDCTQRLNTENCSSGREHQRLARERAERKKQEQAAQLEAAKGNCRGLQLEFRIREGSAGWAFHDRFIIFPRAQSGALAWSLGTSINSFGVEHHILQKVSHDKRRDGAIMGNSLDRAVNHTVDVPTAVARMLASIPELYAQSNPFNETQLNYELHKAFWWGTEPGSPEQEEQTRQRLRTQCWALQELEALIPEPSHEQYHLQIVLTTLLISSNSGREAAEAAPPQTAGSPLIESLVLLLSAMNTGALSRRDRFGDQQQQEEILAAGRRGDYRQLGNRIRHMDMELPSALCLAVMLLTRFAPERLALHIEHRKDVFFSAAVRNTLAGDAPQFALLVNDVTFKFVWGVS